LVGCAPKITYAPAIDGKPVRITSNSAIITDCKFIGNVSAYSGWGGLAAKGVGEAKSTSEVTRKAAAMRGDTVLLITQNVTFSGSTMLGEVYRCRE
jgi:hypothetical protein